MTELDTENTRYPTEKYFLVFVQDLVLTRFMRCRCKITSKTVCRLDGYNHELRR